MRFNKLVCLLALILPLQTFAAEGFKHEKDTLDMCRQFGELMNQKTLSFDKAADFIEPYWVLPKEELQTTRYNAKKLLEIMNERHGDSTGIVHIKTHSAADNTFIRQDFLLKRQKHALVLSCTFYRPNNHEWFLNGVSWHDIINVLFD